MRKLFAIVPIIMILLSHTAAALAGDTTEVKPPSVILVQLSSETNRIRAMEKAHNTEKADIARRDAVGVRQAMTNDFRDNFTFCKVYYFMDTNQEAIIRRQFAGVLMDADGHTIYQPNISADGKYYIVYSGFAQPQSDPKKPLKGTDANLDQAALLPRGLIVCDDSMHQLAYISKWAYADASRKVKASKYYYKSKVFDIVYVPMAARLSKTMGHLKRRLDLEYE